jgi:hypothetical protein
MQNLLRIGTVLAVVLAIVSVNLWRELRAERVLNAQLQAQVDESANRDAASVPAPRVEIRADDTAVTAKNSGATESAPRPLQAAAAVPISPNPIGPVRDLMQDPEYRKARLTQVKMTLKRSYTDVAEELGLSEKETEQLFDLLAEQQMGPNLSLSMGADGQPDRQAMEEMARQRQAAQRKNEEALAALIGPARQPKWQEYQLSLSARSRASQMSGMLASSGYPLTEAQVRPLTTALIAEEKYVRDQQPPSRRSMPTNPESFLRSQEESINQQEESNRRYLETAAPYMSSRQLSLVKEVLEQQIAISRASARMQRERMEAQRSGVAGGASAAGY